MATIRMNTELDALLRRASRHLDLPEAEIVRRTARFIRNGRAHIVAHTAVDEALYKDAGGIVKNYRIAMPEGVAPEDFRRILAARCLLELEKPKASYFQSCLVKGRDYYLDEE